MIVKLQDKSQQFAFDTLISLIVYCAAHRHQIKLPLKIQALAESYINEYTSSSQCEVSSLESI
jgi:hypothetical protein